MDAAEWVEEEEALWDIDVMGEVAERALVKDYFKGK